MDFRIKLHKEFNEIWNYCKSDDNKEWTIGVKKILLKINEKYFNQKVATSSLKLTDSGEWLLDFLIYEEDINYGYLNKIILCAEVEWRNFGDYFSQLKYDFEKLLIVKCNLKLFIFESQDDDELNEYLEKLIIILSNYNKVNNLFIEENYFFIIWNKQRQEFIIVEKN